MARTPRKNAAADADRPLDNDDADATDIDTDDENGDQGDVRERIIQSALNNRHEELRANGVEISDDDEDSDDEDSDRTQRHGEEAPTGSDSSDDGAEQADHHAADSDDASDGEAGDEALPDASSPAAATDAQKIKVKINGQEQEVTLEELTRGYQRGQAADRRFEEAEARYREAEAIEQRVRNGGTQQQDGQRQDDKKADSQTTRTAKDVLGQIDWDSAAQAIQMGDSAEASAALRKTVEEAVTSLGVSDPEATMRQVGEAVSQHISRAFAQRDLHDALLNFHNEYEDVLSTPDLQMMTGTFTRDEINRARQESQETGNPMPSYGELLKRGGERARKFIGSSREAQNGSGTGGNDNGVRVNQDALRGRQDLKRQTSQQPAARRPAGRPPADTDNVVPDETTRARSAIAEIRQKRGQAPIN